MLSDTFLCPVCLENYQHTSHIPKFLSPCGHNVCHVCLQQILVDNSSPKCPTCRNLIAKKDIHEYPTNLSILQVLDKLEDSIFAKVQDCKIHKSPKKFVCMTHFEEMCDICRQKKHKDHEVKTIEEIRKQATDKLTQIKLQRDTCG